MPLSSPLRSHLTPLAAALLISAPAHALDLQPQVITGNPLGSQQLASPSTVLEGDELTLQQQGSLGETLNKQPGWSLGCVPRSKAVGASGSSCRPIAL